MQPDMGQVQFNPRHRQDSQAVQAVFGVRWVLLGLVGYLGQIAWVTMAVLAAGGGFASLDGGVQLALWLLSGAAFACGAWGTWQVVEAMDWGRFVAIGLIIAFLVPYLRLLALLVVALLGFDFIHGRGFRITLWGKPMRRRGAGDAGAPG